MENIPPRIVGLENEYMASYKIIGPGDRLKTLDKLHDSIRDCLVDLLPTDIPTFIADSQFTLTNIWLGNGSRYYMDIGDHIETTTPECVSFDDAVAYDMAGEDYVSQHIYAALAAGVFKVIQLNKRASDHMEEVHTTGVHENYGLSAGLLEKVISINDEYVIGALAAHLGTRSIYTGAGAISYDGKFHLTQKFQDINNVASHSTSKNKPMINYRLEGLAGGQEYSNRLHIVCGDANISPWATWMKLGTTSLVLRLLEHQVPLDDILLEDPVVAAKQVDKDISVSSSLVSEKGKKLTAINLQESLLEKVIELSQRVDLPEEELEVIDEWGEVLDDLRIDPDGCDDRIDWVARKERVDRQTKRVHSNDSEKARLRDLAYDVLLPIRGSGLHHRDNGGFRRTPTTERIQHCRLFPPTNTRANIRGAAVRAFAGHHPRYDSKIREWDKLVHQDRQFHMSDPYEANTARFEEWMNSFR